MSAMLKKIPVKTAACLCTTALVLGLAGCAGSPGPAESPTQGPTAKPGRTAHKVVLDNQFVLDYVLEVKTSTVDGKACYAFISGALTNNSPRTLSKKSVLDFIVMSKGAMVFRDLSNPVSDIPPGGRTMFQLVDSPVHKHGCPVYERIDVSLRKVFAD